MQITWWFDGENDSFNAEFVWNSVSVNCVTFNTEVRIKIFEFAILKCFVLNRLSLFNFYENVLRDFYCKDGLFS